MKNVLITFFSLLILSCQPANKVEEISFNNLTTLIDEYSEATLDKNHINSIAIAIYKNGETYHNYFGEMDTNGNNPPNDSTLYEMASISKVFVGSLAAKAVLEGKITLDDDIRSYLYADYPNLEFEDVPITIKNLLTHTLGFKNKTPKHLAKFNKKMSEGYYENKPLDYDFNDFLEELKTIELDKNQGTYLNTIQ